MTSASAHKHQFRLRVAGTGRGDGRSGDVDAEALVHSAPPHSLEIEAALLGALLIGPEAMDDVGAILASPAAFYLEAHAAIYTALLKLWERKRAGDLVLLVQVLRDAGQLEGVGGSAYLVKLAQETPGPAGAVHFAKVLVGLWRRRLVVEAGLRAAWRAKHAGEADDPEGARALDAAQSELLGIDDQVCAAAVNGAVKLEAPLDELFQRLTDPSKRGKAGLLTGFRALDAMMLGLRPGNLVVVAGRPGMGKTAWGLQLAEQVSSGAARMGAGVPVGFFSLEMDKAELAVRLVASRCEGVPGPKMHRVGIGGEELTTEQVDQVARAIYDLTAGAEAVGGGLHIDDMGGLTIGQLRARARRMVHKHKVELIVVDYLQLLSAPEVRDGGETRQVEVGAISQGLKNMAKELQVPVVAMAQLNRGPANSADNRPRLSHLRESGAIEQDADAVVLLHRESYYHIGDQAWEFDHQHELDKAEFILAKQRAGPVGTVETRWRPERQRYE